MTNQLVPPRLTATQDLEALLDAAVDAIIVIDHSSHILTFNHAAERLFGYAQEQVLGQDISILMPAPYKAAHAGYVDAYLNTGHARIIGIGREISARRRDGSVFPAALSVGKIGDANPPRFVGFIHDISARKAAEESLRQSESLLRNAQSIAQLGNYEYVYPDGVISWSDEMYHLLGLPKASGPLHIKELGQRFVHADDTAHFDRICTHAYTTFDRFDFEFRIHRSDGAVRYIHSQGTVHPHPAGAHVTGTLHDITDRKLAEDELRIGQERLTHVARLSTMGEMAAGLAHEINQPLTAIATYAQAAVRLMDSPDGSDPVDLRDALVQIVAQSLRAGEVIRRLRGFVKTRAANSERLEINRLIEDIRILAGPDARVNDIRLILDLDPRAPGVAGDPIQLQQVLLNLIRNAIDATCECPGALRELTVTTRPLGDGVEVAVIDHAGGIPESVAQHLFNPFFTTKETGTGLGLAISRSIITAHRGKLGYRPTPGGGTSFFFTLPQLVGV